MMKKTIGIVVCILLICTVFTVVGQTVNISNDEKIVYQRDMDGQKHTLFMSGKCFGIGGNESSFKGLFRKNLHWISYSFGTHMILLETILPKSLYERITDSFKGNLIIVDGEMHILNSSFVILENFTGWAPGSVWLLKSFIPFARIRVFGVCNKITILP
jgi:hypothetical protein